MGRYIYKLDGKPIGQLNRTHVHRQSGEYVGELHQDMIVDKHLGNLGSIGNPGNRGAVSYGYPDVFHKLL